MAQPCTSSQARDCEPVRQSNSRLLQTLVAQECCRDCDHPNLVMHIVQPGTEPEEDESLHLKPSKELWICETSTALCCQLPHSPARAEISRNLDLTRGARLPGLLSCSPPLYESCRSTEEEVCWVAFPLQHHRTDKLAASHMPQSQSNCGICQSQGYFQQQQPEPRRTTVYKIICGVHGLPKTKYCGGAASPPIIRCQ